MISYQVHCKTVPLVNACFVKMVLVTIYQMEIIIGLVFHMVSCRVLQEYLEVASAAIHSRCSMFKNVIDVYEQKIQV